MLLNGDRDMEVSIDKDVGEWERKLCREEGMTLKSIRSDAGKSPQ